jgi:hypothetical protein
MRASMKKQGLHKQVFYKEGKREEHKKKGRDFFVLLTSVVEYGSKSTIK